MRVTDYTIVWNENEVGGRDVPHAVRDMLQQGWEPIGGPFVEAGVLGQAMVKYGEPGAIGARDVFVEAARRQVKARMR